MHTLHPFVVHFPIALLTFCLLFELAAWFGRRPALSQIGWWLQFIGTLGVIASVLSGVVAEASGGTALLRAAETFERHEQLAFGVSVVFAVLIFFRFSSHRKLPPGWPRLYLGVLAVTVALLLATGWLGGELVFTYGVGVTSPSPSP
jgi:uncharacterized membrane protein